MLNLKSQKSYQSQVSDQDVQGATDLLVAQALPAMAWLIKHGILAGLAAVGSSSRFWDRYG